MRKTRLQVKTLEVKNLSEKQIKEMWDLYLNSYDNVNEEDFKNDLSSKTHVFMGYDKKTKQFKGFSTFFTYNVIFKNEKVGVIFSGDTIFRKEYWGCKALNLEFIKFCYIWRIKNFGQRLFWNLIASGNKTYLVMARHAVNYYPRYDCLTPAWEKEFINYIGKRQFKDQFCEQTGTIQLSKAQPTLKTHLAPFNKQVLTLPEIDFFVSKNPGYYKGDELSCITEMNFMSFLKVIRKVILKKLKLHLKHLGLSHTVSE